MAGHGGHRGGDAPFQGASKEEKGQECQGNGEPLDAPSRDGTEKFSVVSKRWVVEKSFAWMNVYRRLLKDYEPLCESSQNNGAIVRYKILLKKI